MGTKTGILAFAEDDLRGALHEGLSAEEGATRELVDRLFPDRVEERVADLNLAEAVWPPGDVVYAASFPGVDIVCSQEIVFQRPSDMSGLVARAGSGGQAYAHFMQSAVDWTAFALWDDGDLVRSLSVGPDTGVVENVGEALTFETPYWGGLHPVAYPEDNFSPEDPYPLPFHPPELGEAALKELFGFVIEGMPDARCVDPFEVTLSGFRLNR